MKRERAFTLIELLIVVAIIAILAMIAVPNFLEAQTRAKVSRVKSDLRSFATALEAYFVDWNSYPYNNSNFDNPWDSGEWGGFLALTTPVAYITTIPLDPFGQSRVKGTTPRFACYELGSGIPGGSQAGGRDFSNGKGYPATTWEVESDGPDHIDDTVGGATTGFSFDLNTGAYPWGAGNKIIPNTAEAITAMLHLRYDPTNGTVSSGEVYRCGGAPCPPPVNLFYEGGLK